jgi:hypothetical protein
MMAVSRTKISSPTYSVETVGSSSTSILAADGSRIMTTFINISDEDIYVNVGAAAVQDAGMLVSSGGVWVINDSNYSGEEVFAICSSGGKDMLVCNGISGLLGGGAGGGGSSSSSGGVGGSGSSAGASLYLAPRDFSAVYTSATTITLSGLSFTPDIEEFQFVVAIDSTGSATAYTPYGNAFSYVSGTGVLTVTGATFAGTDGGYWVGISGPDKAYSKAQDATKILELSPISDHEFYAEVADETNVADNTYDYYVDVATYSSVLFTLSLDGDTAGTVTASLEFTAQDDGTAAASCFYVADTSEYPDIQDTGGGGATEGHWHFTLKGAKYVHISIVVASGGGAADYTVLARGQY